MPLTPEEERELNKPYDLWPGGNEARHKRIIELRTLYKEDSIALQEIDGFAAPMASLGLS